MLNGSDIMGLFSVIAVAAPLAYTLLAGIGRHKTLPALIAYYLLLTLFNLSTLSFLHFSPEASNIISITNNFLDNILMFAFLIYLTPSIRTKRLLFYTTIAAIVWTGAVIIRQGYNMDATKYAMALCLPVILIVTAFLTWQHIRSAVSRHGYVGKAMISAALLISYAGYTFLYFVHYLLRANSGTDSLLLYFMVIMLSGIFTTIGIFFEASRVKRLRELKLTRKELSKIYGTTYTKKPASIEAALLPREFLL